MSFDQPVPTPVKRRLSSPLAPPNSDYTATGLPPPHYLLHPPIYAPVSSKRARTTDGSTFMTSSNSSTTLSHDVSRLPPAPHLIASRYETQSSMETSARLANPEDVIYPSSTQLGDSVVTVSMAANEGGGEAGIVATEYPDLGTPKRDASFPSVNQQPPSSLLAQTLYNTRVPSSHFSTPPMQIPSPSSAQKRLFVGSLPPSSPFAASPRAAATRQQHYLPLHLLSDVFSSLLAPSPSFRSTVIPLPNLLMTLEILRTTLSGTSSRLSPKEEVELRVLEGWVGLETTRLLLGSSSVGEEKTAWTSRGQKIGKDIEKSIGKGILLCQKNPHLASFLPQLAIFQADIAFALGNQRFSIKSLKRAISESSSAPICQQYFLLFALASCHINSAPSSSTLALSVLNQLRSLTLANNDRLLATVVSLASLGVLVREGSWREALSMLDQLEAEVGFIAPLPPALKGAPKQELPPPAMPPLQPKTKLERQMLLHYLCLAALVLNHVGEGARAGGVVKVLHTEMDVGESNATGSDALGGGVWEIPLPSRLALTPSKRGVTPPLLLRFTPPNSLYVAACLITSISRRDPRGKRSRKALFALEGIQHITNNAEPSYPPYPTARETQSWDNSKARLHLELLCEVVGACIIRSEFADAARTFDELVAHARSHQLFDIYAPRLLLLLAQIRQSLSQSNGALEAYQAAHHLAPKRSDLALAAKIGEIGLMYGLGRLEEVREEAEKVVKECWAGNGESKDAKGLKGREDVILRTAGGILAALLETEILKSKKHLKIALDFAAGAEDNTSRPLVIGLNAALFLNTREKQSLIMLQTALQLARSLGKEETGGHATMGLWLGEMFEQLLRRNGDEKEAQSIERLNTRHRRTLEKRAEKLGAAAAAAAGMEYGRTD